MQKQEISNIMIFFVTQDLEGQPRQLEMHLMPEKEVSMMNQRFTEYLQRQREMYKPSLVQSHLPDLYLCRYQFPAGVSYPDIRLFDKDNSLVQKFITRNGGSMQGNVSLRGLEYLHSHDEEKSLPMLVASGLADHLLVQPEAKRFALAQDTLHDDPSETLTAVETAKGVLLFEYSGFGKTCCHAYMQHLADRFFITDEEKPEFVNLYKLTRPDAEVVKAFQASPNAFSLYTNSFLPEKAQYLDATILRNARLDRSHRIEPTFDAYDKFASSYNVLPSIANAQILRLLSLQETAGIYGIDYTTRRIPFIHKNSFNSQFNALQNIPAENKGGQEKVKSQIRDQAAYILKRDYGLIPDSLQNKEIDPIISLQTPKGAVYLPATDEGAIYKQCYLQYLADRFFITDEEKPEFVNLYKLTRPDAEVVKAFQASPNAFSLYTNSFLPEKAQYLDATILRNARLDRSHRIEPTFDAYDKFASSYNVLPSIANAQILRLLSLQETAGIYGIDYTTRRIPFIHKNSFNSQFNALQNIPAENKGGQEKVKSQIRDQAAYILKRDYGLIPDSLQNKEIDPIISLQTPKGAVYLPATDEGAIYKQCYLQYLADRFFTPEVQALGRIREFYISCPNHSTEHYMQKHLDLFRSNPFYGQLAKMPLYPIEQSELLKKGGYPIEPTYHAFKQFTEDYRLSVTPENAEIFTLLFIREYGLPADFNTNESYKEFTHKGNFKPLDQEMSELQSKKGYSEKAFYNIQNRQQQLADKILGLRYRLTCPPLQLTGPAASEKRKTASRQNKSHNLRI